MFSSKLEFSFAYRKTFPPLMICNIWYSGYIICIGKASLLRGHQRNLQNFSTLKLYIYIIYLLGLIVGFDLHCDESIIANVLTNIKE